MPNRVGEHFEYPHPTDDGYIVDQGRVKGIDQTVPTIAARNSIFPAVRVAGMQVRVMDSDGSGTEKTYQLGSGLNNSDWTEVVQSGGSGSGGQSRSQAFRELTDVNRTPVQYMGIFNDRKVVSHVKPGKRPGIDADAFEYVTEASAENSIDICTKIFRNNKGYGGANTAYQASSLGIKVSPTSSSPAVIYLNREGIGNPATAGNNANTNNAALPSSGAVASFAFSLDSASSGPTKMRYRLTFHGKDISGADKADSIDVDILLQGAGLQFIRTLDYKVGTGFASFHRVEISKISGDAISTASRDLIVSSVEMKLDLAAYSELTFSERRALKNSLQAGGATFQVDYLLDNEASSYRLNVTDASVKQGDLVFLTSASYDKLPQLTAAQRTDMGSSGIVKLDKKNGAWEVLFREASFKTALFFIRKSNHIYAFTPQQGLSIIHPIGLGDIDGIDRSTLETSWGLFTNTPDPKYGSGTSKWNGTFNPITFLFKAGAPLFSTTDVIVHADITNVSGGGTSAHDASEAGLKLDVSGSSKVVVYFRLDRTEQDLAQPGQMYLSMFGSSKSNVNFEYNVKLTGKDTSGATKTQDLVLSGSSEVEDQWWSVKIADDFKSVLTAEFTDAGKTTSKDIYVGAVGITDPSSLRNIPYLGASGSFRDPGTF